MTITFTLPEIYHAAKEIFKQSTGKKVWAIHGEMGSGKTTFVHALCENLLVTSTVGSPTYSIINEYRTENDEAFYHIDLYRLKDEEEALQAGVEDCFYSGSVCFVEWPERAPGLLPDECFHVYIKTLNDDVRKIEC